MQEPLTHKQKDVLASVSEFIRKNGKSPTLKELGTELKLDAISSVQRHVDALKKKGYINSEKHHARSFQLNNMQRVSIPLVGNVSCGRPLLAEENIEAFIPYDSDKLRGNTKDYFFLRAVGDSMNTAGIDDGDFVLIKNQATAEVGTRIVALIGDEATIKKLQKGNGHYVLQPESTNPQNKPIYIFGDFVIQGVVKDVIKGVNK